MISSTQELVESYLKPGVETEVNISDNMKKNILKMVESRTTEEQLQELLKYLQIAQNEIFMIMSMGSFPRFSKSKLYQEYVRRAREEEVLREAVKALPNHHPLDRQGRATQTTEEMWLASFCKAVNNLPICVSIASTQRGACDVGFPLLHVNPFFEQTTGYSKAEVVGRNCKLLQAGKAEEESIARLSAALRQAAPVKVVITNVRKDGSLFRNLLALKPIMDDSGAYRYVVGVQFDVTQESATPAKLRLVDELLKMLTKNIPSGSNDSPNVKSPS